MSTALLQDYTDKQILWFKCYTDARNRQTFLNGVQSAIVAYGDGISYDTANQNSVGNKKSMAPLISRWLDEECLSEEALKRKLFELMEAEETKLVKVKGAVNQEDLPGNQRVLCVSGLMTREKVDGEPERVFSDGETLLAVDHKANETQRRSLDMALKVRGMYSAEKLDITGLEGLVDRMAKANQRTGGESLPEDDEPDFLE